MKLVDLHKVAFSFGQQADLEDECDLSDDLLAEGGQAQAPTQIARLSANMSGALVSRQAHPDLLAAKDATCDRTVTGKPQPHVLSRDLKGGDLSSNSKTRITLKDEISVLLK
mmetsp:Transcript_2462/g.3193  ORF Transcript_2462/g.3193 Transcript_2462/m.3193 type:complete len:112 (+) Transcript_2462:1-336(+)